MSRNQNPLMKFLTPGTLPFAFGEMFYPSEPDGRLRWFSGPAFEAFLRKIAEEIIDRAVRMVIEDVDRIVFEEEVSDVTM